jgi:hypothetical protein
MATSAQTITSASNNMVPMNLRSRIGMTAADWRAL